MVEEIGEDWFGGQYVIVDGRRHYMKRKHMRIIDRSPKLKVDKVIYNPPATIVFWNDGTKTVVKCQECPLCSDGIEAPKTPEGGCFISRWFKEKGLAHAMLKKTLPGYLDIFKEQGLNL